MDFNVGCVHPFTKMKIVVLVCIACIPSAHQSAKIDPPAIRKSVTKEHHRSSHGTVPAGLHQKACTTVSFLYVFTFYFHKHMHLHMVFPPHLHALQATVVGSITGRCVCQHCYYRACI